jgi:hypothetical protein
MLPQLKHRLVIGLSLVIGAFCWLLALGALTAADGSTGLSLMDARVGLVPAVVIVLAAGLPAIIAGLIAASTGNPLAGTFTISFSLMPLAAMGGSIEGYLKRTELPGGFRPLASEAIIWLVLLAVIFIVIDRLRTKVRPGLQKLAVKRHMGTRTQLAFPSLRPLLAGLVAAGAGAFICNILIQTSDGGQVNCGLILGFGVAAMIAQLTVPHRNPLVILLSPLLVAAVAYLYTAWAYPAGDELLYDLYSRNLLNLALALPIQYASSGVAGCALGIGLAQTLDHARHTSTATA